MSKILSDREIEKLSFDDAMMLLEEAISNLENDKFNDPYYFEYAQKLKSHCSTYLAREKANIKRIAQDNNIPLSQIGLGDDD